ncbi:MAG: rRNA (uracil1498-N3)-methyltransferase [Actinomycetota bacterium]|nr:rRNA (uracil1498-N3)-methyltransferase [Actinomycetota bacterium]
MSLPLFVAGRGSLDGVAPGSAFVLDGDEGRHAAVRRIRAGERIDVADGAGRVARCVVGRAERDHLRLTVERVTDVEPRLPRLVLVQALAKGGRDEQAVETATELGVDAVVPWQAERSVVRWSGDRADRSRHRWEATAFAAAKQSRRATVPLIEPCTGTAELVARAGPHGPGDEVVLVLHEEAAEPLTRVTIPDAAAVLVVVGPEGGITPGEIDRLTAAGARAVRLGPEVLRASSAGPAALAVLSARLGRW